jgi:hypothetical protein
VRGLLAGLSNRDINLWRAWFKWHGTTLEQENLRMLHQCCAAAGAERSIHRALEYAKEQYGGAEYDQDDPALRAVIAFAAQHNAREKR